MKELYEKNKQWVNSFTPNQIRRKKQLSLGQNPKYLWIGCSDSRVCPEKIFNLDHGEIFVHRNIANMLPPDDRSSQAVLEYAINHLNIKNIIVCGHYGCGGAHAAMQESTLAPPLSNWLSPLKELYNNLQQCQASPENGALEFNRFVEINVLLQIMNIGLSDNVRLAWERGENLTLYGLVYDIATGLVKDPEVVVNSSDNFRKFLSAHKYLNTTPLKS